MNCTSLCILKNCLNKKCCLRHCMPSFFSASTAEKTQWSALHQESVATFAAFSLFFHLLFLHKLRRQHFPLLRYVPRTCLKVITAIETPCMLNVSFENQHARNRILSRMLIVCLKPLVTYPVSFLLFSSNIHICAKMELCSPSPSGENVEVNSSQLNSMTHRLSESLFVCHTAFRHTWMDYSAWMGEKIVFAKSANLFTHAFHQGNHQLKQYV